MTPPGLSQFRLLLSSWAYVLIDAIRRLGLRDTKLARAQVGTTRLKLFKIGAVITRNTRRIRVHLSSASPFQDLFVLVKGMRQVNLEKTIWFCRKAEAGS